MAGPAQGPCRRLGTIITTIMTDITGGRRVGGIVAIGFMRPGPTLSIITGIIVWHRRLRAITGSKLMANF